MNVIALHGPAGSGKSTVADILCADYDYYRLPMADALKDIVFMILERVGEPDAHDKVYGQRKEEELVKFPGITTRYMLQTLGTDWGRMMIHPDIWVMMQQGAIQEVIDNYGWDTFDGVVVDDVRFGNELNMLKTQFDATSALIHREYERPNMNYDHPSEQYLPPAWFDLVCENGDQDAPVRIAALLHTVSEGKK